jgi:hypothetical protein
LSREHPVPRPEALTERRRLLASEPNPGGQLDYLVLLDSELGGVGAVEVHVRIAYVPDRDILQPGALEAYLGLFSKQPWLSLEAMALAILDDLNNEIVPRWIMVRLRGQWPGTEPHTIKHSVTVEDRQPGWANPELLAQLARS